jgi:hypothetical protein
MAQPTERSVLRRLLAHYDQLGLLREQLSVEDIAAAETRRLQNQSRKKIDAIGRDLRQFPQESQFGSLLARYKLSKYELVVLLALLRRRLTNENPYLKGRELLSLLFDGSYDVLRGSAFLEPTGALQSAGLIVPDVREEEEDDLLETPFKLSDRVFRLARSTFVGARGGAMVARAKPAAYRSNLAYVQDYRRLSLLYRKRASKIFQFDYWEDVGLGTAETVTVLNDQLVRFRGRMRECLKRTPKADRFALASFEQEYRLDEEQLVVLITLLYQELTEGGAFLDAVDLVKLVSVSEEDLLRKRHFFSKRSPLIKSNVVALEEMVHDKELTAEVYLPNWVIDRMLGTAKGELIDADTRLDFHDYLNRLDSSEDFFDELESND